MKENNGWVKFHRKITDWGWYDDANTFRLFFHLIVTANHDNRVWMGTEVNRGSLVTSYPHLAEKLKLTVQNIRTSIFKLKSTGEITVKTTNKFSVVSINNYDAYQEINSQTNKRLTVNQQATNTKQEYKNIRSKEDINININTPKAGDGFINRILETFREKVGHNPTDPKPRYEAYNLVRRIKKLIKEVGKPDTEEQTNRVIDKYFEWLDKQDWFVNVQNMSVVRRKFEIYQQNVINHLKPNVQEN